MINFRQVLKMNIDTEIYNLLKARNEKGLSMLYKNYSSSLFGISFRILNNNAFAEDAIQKSFLKIWNNIEQYDSGKSTLFTWMAKIVRNTSIDIRRLKSFQVEEKSETLNPKMHDSKKSYIDTNKIDTSSILSGLDEKYAFVIEHLYLKGYSQSELAEEFDIPLGTIKTRVKKGITILRSKLDKEKKFMLGIFLITLLIIISVIL